MYSPRFHQIASNKRFKIKIPRGAFPLNPPSSIQSYLPPLVLMSKKLKENLVFQASLPPIPPLLGRA